MNKLHQNFYKLDKRIAYLIGVLYGDGNILYNRIRFGVKDKDFILNIKNCLEDLSKRSLKIKKRKNNSFKKSFLYHIELNSILLKPIILKHYNSIKKEKNKQILAYFLAGCFDSEGSVDKNRLRIRLLVRNKEYINRIANSLKKLNIPYTLKKILNHKVIFYCIRIYDINVLKFHRLIHFSIKRKQKRLEGNINQYYQNKEYQLKKRKETLILKEKKWCKKYNLTRNQYYRHKRLFND